MVLMIQTLGYDDDDDDDDEHLMFWSRNLEFYFSMVEFPFFTSRTYYCIGVGI
jgi:hypothetical protein